MLTFNWSLPNEALIRITIRNEYWWQVTGLISSISTLFGLATILQVFGLRNVAVHQSTVKLAESNKIIIQLHF